MNAIILAAGMGTRLRPLTNDIPKALVKINGGPIIERQIKYLREIGIEKIIIVTGYLNTEFNYLIDNYDVELIYNDKYDVYNNGYTMYLVREYLQNSYVLEGDVYLTNNFLEPKLKQSTYFGGRKENFTNEWILEYNADNEITHIRIGSGSNYIMSGISYWSVEDGKKIKDKLEKMINDQGFKDLFWDDLIKDNLDDYRIKIKKIESNDWFEIDSIKDLEKVEQYEKKNI